MKLVILHGPPGVGKMTVAKALVQITHFSILHNHQTIDLVTTLFPFGSEAFHTTLQKVRLTLIDEAIAHGITGIVQTTGLPNTDTVRDFYTSLAQRIRCQGGDVAFVLLHCDQAALLQRVVRDDRKTHGKIQTVPDVLDALDKQDFFTPMNDPNALAIDTTTLTAVKTAQHIKDQCQL